MTSPRARVKRSRRVAAVLAGLASLSAPGVIAAAVVEIATWNLEWLIAPDDFRRLARSCVADGGRIRGNQRAIPCDVAARLERSRADFAALARYAALLASDVVALQEVDGPEAARLVFPGHRFCFTARRHVQNVGFAIRPGIPYRCGRDLTRLSLDDTVRRGAELVLFPGDPREVRLLNVHLKSGCARQPLDGGKRECAALARQAVVLEGWIDAEARAGRRFVVLGDFNRDLLRDTGPPRGEDGRLRHLWTELDDADPPEADLTLAADGQRFVNCAANQAHRGYIDHIALSRSLAAAVVPGSFERVTFRTEDALRLRLSDHCPVAVRIRLAP
jgi:endonuclease/exonuclease/phosphatase family metal-dependent hydrolase